jgi:hypothetical protein
MNNFRDAGIPLDGIDRLALLVFVAAADDITTAAAAIDENAWWFMTGAV